jgi:hypothetical protein
MKKFLYVILLISSIVKAETSPNDILCGSNQGVKYSFRFLQELPSNKYKVQVGVNDDRGPMLAIMTVVDGPANTVSYWSSLPNGWVVSLLYKEDYSGKAIRVSFGGSAVKSGTRVSNSLACEYVWRGQ